MADYPPSLTSSISNAATSSIPGTPGGNVNDTRRRQTKRDEAIRKKIEAELSRKRTPARRGAGANHGTLNAGSARKTKALPGTVQSLRPLSALTVRESLSVSDASQLCAAKRMDCVLVVDDEEHLCGIFTAKDLAFRVVGESLDPRTTPVSAIMTRNPMVTRDSTSATEALNTMVKRGFRHLPVCNEEGDVVGLLDITKVFHEALEKLERAYHTQKALYTALEGVQSEWGSMQSASQGLMAYVEQLQEKMAYPDLASVLVHCGAPVIVGVRTSVREAARLMRAHHTTAVCVMDGERIAGIITSKDVVLRVIATGLAPDTCSVVRVMTPHPDTAEPTINIQEALRKMYGMCNAFTCGPMLIYDHLADGHYLNLPVTENGKIVGIVDVLKLTYATLEQMESMSSSHDDKSGGPMWNHFWSSLGRDEETGSALSDSQTPSKTGPSQGGRESQTTGRDLVQTPYKSVEQAHDLLTSPGADLGPNDSASAVATPANGPFDQGYFSTDTKNPLTKISESNVAAAAKIDDGTYVFKFKAPRTGATHRLVFAYKDNGIEDLRADVHARLLQHAGVNSPAKVSDKDKEIGTSPSHADLKDQGAGNDFRLSYLDGEGDEVIMTTDDDILDAIAVARKKGLDRVMLGIHEPGLAPTLADERLGKSALSAIADPVGGASGKAEMSQEKFLGLPKDMALPAAITGLSIVILGVFFISRTSK